MTKDGSTLAHGIFRGQHIWFKSCEREGFGMPGNVFEVRL